MPQVVPGVRYRRQAGEPEWSSDPWLRRFLSRIDWSKVVDANSCWIWTGCQRGGRPDDRYSHFDGFVIGPGAEGGEYYYCGHTYSYARFVGPIPEGYDIDHICKTHLCVNPTHLRPLTHNENVAVRRKKTHCKNGHEFTPENTRVYVYSNKRAAVRICKTCARVRWNNISKLMKKDKKVRDKIRKRWRDSKSRAGNRG